MARIGSVHSVPATADAYKASTIVDNVTPVVFPRPEWAKAYNISVTGESVLVNDSGFPAAPGAGLLIPADTGPIYRPISSPKLDVNSAAPGPSVIATAVGPASVSVEFLA